MVMTNVELGAHPAAADDVADFTAFYRSHLAETFRLACLLAGGALEAEDVVAEVFARAYPAFVKGSVTNWHGYLRRAVLNELQNRSRHLRIRRREEERRSRPSEMRPTEDRVADREVVLAALAVLPVRQRAGVVLRYYLDLSEAETASLLGISVGAVKSSVSRGLDRLRDLLEER